MSLLIEYLISAVASTIPLMTLAGIIREAIKKVLARSHVKEIFQNFEGDKVALKLRGDRTLIFTVSDGMPIIVEVEREEDIQNANAIAEVDVREFIRFIDGSEHFGALFSTDLKRIFKTIKGDFYDLGGDFMLIGPICEELANMCMNDPELQSMIEKYKKGLERESRGLNILPTTTWDILFPAF